MPPSSWALRVVSSAAFVGLVALAVAGVGAAPACATHECEYGPIPMYRVNHDDPASPALGELVTPDTWESNPIDSDWLDFNPRTGWNITVDRWFAEQRPIVEMHAYVSETKHPNASGNNFTEGTGNIAEFSHAGPGNIWVYNDTCAQYYVRVTLRAGPPMADAGTE